MWRRRNSSSAASARRRRTDSVSSAAKGAAAAPTPPLTRHTVRAPETLSSAQRSRLARTGSTTIPVTLGGPGTLTAFGQAGIGHAIVKVAHAAPVRAKGRGVVHFTLRLTPRARRRLAAGHSFVMYVGVYSSKSPEGQRITVPLKPDHCRGGLSREAAEGPPAVRSPGIGGSLIAATLVA